MTGLYQCVFLRNQCTTAHARRTLEVRHLFTLDARGRAKVYKRRRKRPAASETQPASSSIAYGEGRLKVNFEGAGVQARDRVLALHKSALLREKVNVVSQVLDVELER